MKLENQTGLPLDLVVLINFFLYEKLTDGNFYQAIALWFEDEERFGHMSFWNTSRVTNTRMSFYLRMHFNEDISRWNVSNVTNMCSMFHGATAFSGDLSRWEVRKVKDMSCMFDGASRFNGESMGCEQRHRYELHVS
jgi:surface protein